MAIDGKNKMAGMVTWLLRILVGGVFVFSGFAKAIDPWGTLYKFDAYLASMSIDIWPNLELVGVFALCVVEFLTGVFLIFGCFRRSSAILAAVIMAVMLPLTLWIAISNPVSDCGCFGDAFIISNWATFWKNVVLAVAIAWLVVHNSRCHWLITPALQWIAFVVSALFVVAIELFGYVSQPLIDFRPYKLGEELIDSDYAYDDGPEYVFIYEKDSVKKEFKEDDILPDEADGWTFVDRREIKHEREEEAPTPVSGKNLRIWDKTGEEDVTDAVIADSGKELLVMMPVLKDVSPATTWKLNSLYEWSVKNDVEMAAVVSGSQDEISEWEDLSMASYPIYTADDTQIKEVVRGNPGVVYLVDGRIEWKSTLTAINVDDFLSPETSSDAMSFGTDNMRILRNCLYLYIIIMAVLVFLSFTPWLKNVYFKTPARSKASADDNTTVETEDKTTEDADDTPDEKTTHDDKALPGE